MSSEQPHYSIDPITPEEATDIHEHEVEMQRYREFGIGMVNTEHSESCQHIVRNALAHMSKIDITRLSKSDREDVMKAQRDGMETLKIYRVLLEDFPDFRVKEETPGSGYFPDWVHGAAVSSHEVVRMYEKRLRGIQERSAESETL